MYSQIQKNITQLYNYVFFFFNDTATTEIYTHSLHDALPISAGRALSAAELAALYLNLAPADRDAAEAAVLDTGRSEEHTSELQSQSNLVCRLLLEKKKNTNVHTYNVQTVSTTPLRHWRLTQP